MAVCIDFCMLCVCFACALCVLRVPRSVSRLTPEEKDEVRELETAMDTHPRRQCAKMIIVTVCLCGLLGVPITLLLMAFVG